MAEVYTSSQFSSGNLLFPASISVQPDGVHYEKRKLLGSSEEVISYNLPAFRFEGKVVRLAPGFDPVTRTLEAEVRVPNPTGELRVGMYGRGAIILDVHKDAVVVTANALQISNDRKYVFVLEGDVARRRDIETGFDHGTWLEVPKGLTGGAEVITAGADGLADRMKVRPVRDVDPYTGAAARERPAGGPASGKL